MDAEWALEVMEKASYICFQEFTMWWNYCQGMPVITRVQISIQPCQRCKDYQGVVFSLLFTEPIKPRIEHEYLF